MTEFTNNTTTQVTTETLGGGRAQLSLMPSRSTVDPDTRHSAGVEAYLADQKAQQSLSRGGRDYLNIDDAYNLGVGAKSKWTDPHNDVVRTTIRQVDPAYKANLDSMLARGVISQNGYEMALRQALGEDIDAESPPEADVAPMQYDQETSRDARFVIDQVGDAAFNAAMTAYVMGDAAPATNLASRLHEHGVTVADMTGLYDRMATTALQKIDQVREANGDTDIDIRDVVQWARGLERGQTRELAQTVMASAMFDNYQHVPQLMEAFRRAKGIRR